MEFQDWWNGLTKAEQKVLGVASSRFVWEECQKLSLRLIPEAGQGLQIAGWTLRPGTQPGTTWIGDGSGEGGNFETYELAEAIGAFYKEKF